MNRDKCSVVEVQSLKYKKAKKSGESGWAGQEIDREHLTSQRFQGHGRIKGKEELAEAKYPLSCYGHANKMQNRLRAGAGRAERAVKLDRNDPEVPEVSHLK